MLHAYYSNVYLMYICYLDAKNLMTINAVLEFEDTITLASLRQIISERILALKGREVQRLKQRVVDTMIGRCFEDVCDWTINDHVVEDETLFSTDEQLQEYLSQKISQPLNKSKPLWLVTLLSNYKGKSAIVMRIHHVLGDGTYTLFYAWRSNL